jgi:hypothetical protein
VKRAWRAKPPCPTSRWCRRDDRGHELVYVVDAASRHGVLFRLVSRGPIRQPSRVLGLRSFLYEFEQVL